MRLTRGRKSNTIYRESVLRPHGGRRVEEGDMTKLGILFAGQGAQYPGMGKDLCEQNAAARAVWDRMTDAMPELPGICWDAPPEELARTEYTQPAVFAVDMACFAALRQAGVSPDAGAGFSLGEYAAVCAAGVYDLEQTFDLVRERAGWMQSAAAKHPGGMLAVLGAELCVVRNLIGDVAGAQGVFLANCNAPGQIVLAGREEGLAAVQAACKSSRLRCQRLAVSGPFHTPYMREVTQKLAAALSHMPPKPPAFTLYSNATGEPHTPDAFVGALARQASEPVLWEKTLHNMLAGGVDTFIEVGPGKTLTGLLRRIDKTKAAYNVFDMQSLRATVSALCAESTQNSSGIAGGMEKE